MNLGTEETTPALNMRFLGGAGWCSSSKPNLGSLVEEHLSQDQSSSRIQGPSEHNYFHISLRSVVKQWRRYCSIKKYIYIVIYTCNPIRGMTNHYGPGSVLGLN